jgi:GTP 3',8-cyclase
VRQLRNIEGLRSLSLTTNGILLKQQAAALAQAGLTRINVSLDSLVHEKFAQLTRRDQLDHVLQGLEELENYPSIHPIKVNAVVIRGYSEEEALDFVRLARRKAYVMRWIEFMPLDADQIWRKEDILTGAELKAIIEDEYGPLVPITSGDPSETARRCPHFKPHCRTVSYLTTIPRCAKSSSISRELSEKRNYNQTAWLIISEGKWNPL